MPEVTRQQGRDDDQTASGKLIDGHAFTRQQMRGNGGEQQFAEQNDDGLISSDARDAFLDHQVGRENHHPHASQQAAPSPATKAMPIA